MTKRILISILTGATLLGAGASVAAADERIPSGVLSPAYIIHKLAADGTELRSIEYKRGAYIVDVATGEGRTYRAAVDPDSGELNSHAFMGRTFATDSAPAGSISRSLIVQAVANAGFGEVIEMEMKNTLWKVKAQDDAGRVVKLWVDPVTGSIEEQDRKIAFN